MTDKEKEIRKQAGINDPSAEQLPTLNPPNPKDTRTPKQPVRIPGPPVMTQPSQADDAEDRRYKDIEREEERKAKEGTAPTQPVPGATTPQPHPPKVEEKKK